jgi:hypothetical protein
MRAFVPLVIAVVAVSPARADIKFEGYGDVRLVLPADDDETWFEGGLSKTRFGRADGDAELRLGEIVGEAVWQITPEVMALGWVRYDEDQRTPIDLIEAYARYRPVSTNEWLWSVKAGAFFPPISLENNEIGWTSTWTLTPSAINSWVGEELRTIGAEAKLELRGSIDTLEANVALFGWNDPAGVLIDVRGWALHDRPTGLFDKPRLPDALAIGWGLTPPLDTAMFKEVDDRVGYYARLGWLRGEEWLVEVLRYDNRANPAAYDEVFAWRTEFWSAGARRRMGEFTLIGQVLAGETEIAPMAGFNRVVEFWSAFVLAGWERGEWALGLRGELFGSDGTAHVSPNTHNNLANYGEYGHAVTFAAAWSPEEWLRVSAEALVIDSYRPRRRITGLDAQSLETQFQLGVRAYY